MKELLLLFFIIFLFEGDPDIWDTYQAKFKGEQINCEPKNNS